MKNVFSISPRTYNFWYTCTTQSRNYREVCKAALPWPRAVPGRGSHRPRLGRRKGEAGTEGDGEGGGQGHGARRARRKPPCLSISVLLGGKKVHPEPRGQKSMCY